MGAIGVLGADTLAGVIDPEQTAWARHHRERWDGGGSPDGLAGDDIPEGATLIAVADACDVMVTGGSRAAPRTPADALEQGRPTKRDRRQLAEWQRWSASSDDAG